jgi:hypothetical protein
MTGLLPRRKLNSFVLVALACQAFACERLPLESAAGEHATVHWNPDTHQLCGGTLAYIDKSLALVAENYDRRLPRGRSLDIFWDDGTLAPSVCGRNASDCVVVLPNGTSMMFSDSPVHAHELAHTVRLAGDRQRLPSFLSEGVAVRWEVGHNDGSVGKESYVGSLDYATVTRLLTQRGRISPDDYPAAGFFWSWLEAQYGPAKMAEFTGSISFHDSISEIEQAFKSAFGVSLRSAIDASQGHPLYMFDVHACMMADLPVLDWHDQDITLSQGAGECDSADVVNLVRYFASRWTRLRLPDQPAVYQVSTTGPVGSSVRFDACTGSVRPYSSALQMFPTTAAAEVALSGEYVVSVVGPVSDDGSVGFPEVVLTR